MDKIKVKKSELLDVLRSNRARHREIFLDAQEEYRKAAIAELDNMLTEARAGKKIRRSVTLVEPIDQTRDYDQAIRMLEMDTQDIIELTSELFRCYVMDEWRWMNQFLAVNSTYSKKMFPNE